MYICKCQKIIVVNDEILGNGKDVNVFVQYVVKLNYIQGENLVCTYLPTYISTLFPIYFCITILKRGCNFCVLTLSIAPCRYAQDNK